MMKYCNIYSVSTTLWSVLYEIENFSSSYCTMTVLTVIWVYETKPIFSKIGLKSLINLLGESERWFV